MDYEKCPKCGAPAYAEFKDKKGIKQCLNCGFEAANVKLRG